jgi:hypothetical protein
LQISWRAMGLRWAQWAIGERVECNHPIEKSQSEQRNLNSFSVHKLDFHVTLNIWACACGGLLKHICEFKKNC